ncbi:hypothetical protein ABIB57_004443 [Devosia sp. UYZn731]|uniref:hypothetical protein n=1 Tax=Devosia sp. UYZn731 TaxID=3156345 RepID=UPI003390A852
MHSFTTDLKDHDTAKFRLTEQEAWEMQRVGFRFSIFNPLDQDYRISIPFRLLHNLDRGTVTLQQEEAWME